MITVLTPFSRIENKELLLKVLEGKCNWTILQHEDEPVIDFPDWVQVKRLDVTKGPGLSNRLLNEFFAGPLERDTQYMVLCDDDSVEEGFFDKIPNEDVVCVSMKRNEASTHHVWDDWATKVYHFEEGPDILWAQPDYMKVARVGGEQLIVKGKILKNFRYGAADSSADIPGDFRFISQIINEYPPVYVRDALVLFNYFEDGRFTSFRRKPLVLFVGDYYCAGNPAMGISEWETNIWKSLESTNKADIARFHMDKYYYHYGKRGDQALIEAVTQIKPDYVVLIVYKPLESDPTVLNLDALTELSKYNLVTIWGDLEAEEQQDLAKVIAPYCKKVFGTANEEIVTSLGYTYTHVPKDPRIFNNPGKVRDIDVLFNGSFGYGREERREVLQYLIDSGIKLVAGGSEGGDHFSTEEYANRYKRAKIAISFSRARGQDVVNARPFEAMLTGALVLNQDSKEMEKLYQSGVDFISWNNKEQLLGWIKTLLVDDENLNKVALNGQKKTEQLYSAETFWDKALA